MHADQLFARVAEADARLAVDVDQGSALVLQEERIGGGIDERAKARLARTTLFLGATQLGDVLHHSELPSRLAWLGLLDLAAREHRAHFADGPNDAELQLGEG